MSSMVRNDTIFCEPNLVKIFLTNPLKFPWNLAFLPSSCCDIWHFFLQNRFGPRYCQWLSTNDSEANHTRLWQWVEVTTKNDWNLVAVGRRRRRWQQRCLSFLDDVLQAMHEHHCLYQLHVAVLRVPVYVARRYQHQLLLGHRVQRDTYIDVTL